jgi:hypothetical protein
MSLLLSTPTPSCGRCRYAVPALCTANLSAHMCLQFCLGELLQQLNCLTMLLQKPVVPIDNAWVFVYTSQQRGTAASDTAH